jgi:hypothetical protein
MSSEDSLDNGTRVAMGEDLWESVDAIQYDRPTHCRIISQEPNSQARNPVSALWCSD